jgi:hypothetical protein
MIFALTDHSLHLPKSMKMLTATWTLMILAFKSDENADSCIKINENPAQINANADSCINIIDFSSHRSQLPASEIDENADSYMNNDFCSHRSQLAPSEINENADGYMDINDFSFQER